LLPGLIPQWPMLVTAFAALGMYSLVLVQGRYVAVFLAVAWTGLFAGLRLPATKETRKLAMAASVALLIAVGAPLTLAGGAQSCKRNPSPSASAMGGRTGATPDGSAAWRQSSTRRWHLRGRLGPTIASQSCCRNPSYFRTRILDVKLISAGASNEAFRKTGARIVVAQQIPPLEVFAPTPGWRRIGNTNFYVFQFQPDSKLPE